MLDAAKYYPIKGLFKLNDLPDLGEMQVIPIGIPGLSDLINVIPESLTVLTGYPGQGTTSLTMAIVGHPLRHNVPACLGPFETFPQPISHRTPRASIIACRHPLTPPHKTSLSARHTDTHPTHYPPANREQP